MGILSKWFGNSQPMTEQSDKVEKSEIWMRLSVSQNGNNVSIKVHGLETVNVCLASFLTKGVSYAQEKFNEYQANKDTDAIVEEPKAEKPRREIKRPTQRDIDEMRALAKAKTSKERE